MKSVLITGVNGGIGGACADEFKSHGYHVYGTDKAEVTNGVADEFFPGSITDEDMWKRISEKFKEKNVALDALVNIAGRNYFSPIEQADINEWRDMFDVNVNGMVCAIKHSKQFLEKTNTPEYELYFWLHRFTWLRCILRNQRRCRFSDQITFFRISSKD
jgi:NADP-dependent 3-hydroxy acid dehydrogenase YdfG